MQLRGDLVAERDPAEQQAEARVGGRVEDVAGDDDERLPERLARHQRPARAPARSGRRSRTRPSGRASARGRFLVGPGRRAPPVPSRILPPASGDARSCELGGRRTWRAAIAAIAVLAAVASTPAAAAADCGRRRPGQADQERQPGAGAAGDRRLADAARAAQSRRRGLPRQRARLPAVARGPRRDSRPQAQGPPAAAGRRSRSARTARSTKGDIHKALDLLGKKRILGLVDAARARRRRRTRRGARPLGGAQAQADPAARLGQATAPGIRGWFQPDGLHLTFDGAEAMARLFSDLLHLLPNPH